MVQAKQKAEELVDRFMPLVYCYSGSGMLTNSVDESVQLSFAKEAAIIAVDEIMAFIKTMWTHESAETVYWQEVRNEITKL